MNKMHRLVVVVLLFAVSGCMTAAGLNNEGNNLFDARSYKGAIDRYEAALRKTQKTGDQQYAAMAMYGLGRANGYLCNFKKAENWFLQSIAIRETIPDVPGVAWISQNRFELARLYASAKQWEKAQVQFELAIPFVEEKGVEKIDPIGYADVLEDYLKALVGVNNTGKAEKVQQKINELRRTHSGSPPNMLVEPYPTNCPSYQ